MFPLGIKKNLKSHFVLIWNHYSAFISLGWKIHNPFIFSYNLFFLLCVNLKTSLRFSFSWGDQWKKNYKKKKRERWKGEKKGRRGRKGTEEKKKHRERGSKGDWLVLIDESSLQIVDHNSIISHYRGEILSPFTESKETSQNFSSTQAIFSYIHTFIHSFSIIVSQRIWGKFQINSK